MEVRVDQVLRDDVELGGRRDFLREHLLDRREHEPSLLGGEARQAVERQRGREDGEDRADEELPAGEAESFRILRGDVDQDVVQDGGVDPRAEQLAQRRKGRAHERRGPEEARAEERQDERQEDRRGAERVERQHVPSVLQPLLDPSEEGRVDAWQDEEDPERGQQGEELRAFAERVDEERLDRARRAADREVDRDLRQEDAEGEGPHEERDEQAGTMGAFEGTSEPFPTDRPHPDRDGSPL